MLTVIGEALVDVVARPESEPVRHPGGSPMNVAVGLTRLGQQVRFLGTWGSDADGELLERRLRAEGVELPLEQRSARTSVARATLDDQGSATYDFQLEWDLQLDPEHLERIAAESRAVHAGSIAAVLDPGSESVMRALETCSGRTLVSFDPNCRPTITQDVDAVRERVERCVRAADVVKASHEDLLWLYPGSTLQETARDWHALGAAMVVVTRGELGPWVLTDATGEIGVDVPAVRTEVADTVGAGDTFMAALIAQLVEQDVAGPQAGRRIRCLDEQQVRTLLERAAQAAAVTVSRAGADLPRRAELDW